MDGAGGECTSEEKFTAEIQTAADSLDGAVLFHLVVDVLGFLLFMHQQIPSILQDMSLQFDGLQMECKELMIQAQTERNASVRRSHAGRMREAKHGIKRMEKLMKTLSSFRTALQLLISEVLDVREVMLILGANPARPLYVYELCFSHGKVVSRGAGDFTRTKAAEGLSRKTIRSLLSAGAGSCAYAGSLKLFLLIKAPPSLNMPVHFLPKRDFRYHKKVSMPTCNKGHTVKDIISRRLTRWISQISRTVNSVPSTLQLKLNLPPMCPLAVTAYSLVTCLTFSKFR